MQLYFWVCHMQLVHLVNKLLSCSPCRMFPGPEGEAELFRWLLQSWYPTERPWTLEKRFPLYFSLALYFTQAWNMGTVLGADTKQLPAEGSCLPSLTVSARCPASKGSKWMARLIPYPFSWKDMVWWFEMCMLPTDEKRIGQVTLLLEQVPRSLD